MGPRVKPGDDGGWGERGEERRGEERRALDPTKSAVIPGLDPGT